MKESKLFFSLLIIILPSCSNKTIIIESFEIANRNMILKDSNHYVTQNYLIKNWKDTRKIETQIDSFVCSVLNTDFLSIYGYSISFYNYSEVVNHQYYSTSKKLCELKMVDAHLLSYSFTNGLFSKTKGNAKKYLEPLTEFKCDKLKK